MQSGQQKSPSTPAAETSKTIEAQGALERRNRNFALIWAILVGFVFILTFAIAITVHYVEVHHVFAKTSTQQSL